MPGVVKMLSRVVVVGGVCIVAVSFAICSWFFLYSADVPQLKEAARYAPSEPQTISAECSETPVMAVPYSSIAKDLRNALTTAESPRGTVTLRVQLARLFLCNEHGRILNRHVKELRLASQLALHFSSDQILTIYANRIYLGDGITGVQAASQHYFRKSASQLNLAESAMIGGLARSPNIYSPRKHPDRAVTRRNQVIDAMLSAHAVTEDEAAKAKSEVPNIIQ